MRRRVRIRVRVLMAAALLGAASVGLAACGGGTIPENHFYRLHVAPPEAAKDGPAAAPLLRGTVEVQRFLAGGALSQRPLVYHRVDRPRQVKAYHYHFWDLPPGLLLSDELIDYLRRAGAAERVVASQVRANVDYVVSGRVQRFERVIGGPPKGVVELDLHIHRTSDGKLLFTRAYKREVEAEGRDLLATVEGMSAAVGSIYAEFIEDIGTIDGTLRAGGS